MPTEADLWARLAATDWAAMKHWERMVWVLHLHGPTTSGALGHVRGIGQNVRGIRAEADRGLAPHGLYVERERIEGVPWKRYRLASLAMRKALERTDAVVAEEQGRLDIDG